VPGEAGKPSPASTAEMQPPPPPKRPSSAAAQASMAAARTQPSDIGRKQQGATGAPPPPPPKPMAPPPARPPTRGEKLLAATAAAQQVASVPDNVLRALGGAMSREMSRDVSPVRSFPDLLGDAVAAGAAISEYKSPHTGERTAPAAAATTRSSEALKGTTITVLAQRLEASGPTTRAQQQVSKAAQRAWAAQQKRESRARDAHYEASCAQVMVDLARYDIPLVQLLMAEFALQPCNEGSAGQMRWRFLEQYGRTCHTLWADVPSKVLSLPELACVLRTYKPARVLLLLRLYAMKEKMAQCFSGAHRLGRIKVDHSKTLMQMRIEIFDEQRRSGRTADDLEGLHPDMPQLIQTMENGRYSLDFRHAVHVHRHFSCSGSVLSYANTTQSAISGALLFIKNLTKDALPPVMSRQAMTRHDQHFDWVQRLLGCRELREANSVLTVSYDDASQRGVKFNGVGLFGTRLDLSSYYEVIRVTRLVKDLVTGKTGSGLNGARSVMGGLRHHMQDAMEDMLWQLAVILVDTTTTNTGTKILTGEGGSAAHLRSMIEKATRGDEELGHFLIEARDCISHMGHNEAETILYAFGACEEGRAFMKTKQTIDEEKGSKPRCWMKTDLDEATQYVFDRPKLIAFIEKREALKAGSLRKPPGGVKERMGFYGQSIQWYRPTTGRIELICEYAVSEEPAYPADENEETVGIPESDLTMEQRISLIKDDGVRAMLLEFANPAKRLAFIVWEWHYTNSLSRWLNFTQNDSDPLYQMKRVHRVIRLRLQLLEPLKGSTDAADGPWNTQLKPILDAFMTKHSSVYNQRRDIKPREIARVLYSAAYDDFYTRTRGYMESPLCLPLGMLDEKGHAVRTAKELLELAGSQGPMVGLPQRLAYDPKKAKPSSAEAKGRLHEGIDAPMIIKGVRDARYRGITLCWLGDLWSLVIKLSGMDPSTIIRDVPELAPLDTHLLPFGRTQSTNVRVVAP
jgi:hypothetical protein